uniref:Putative protoheme IX farnesyltransferase n=1 Tax=mine drainage metagenome TaxID=410659 RepID=E6PQM4_9ZZZZ
MPFAMHMSGIIYAVAAVLLDAVFIAYAWELKQRYSDALARKMFRYSIVYLWLLFAAMLVDHYLMF